MSQHEPETTGKGRATLIKAAVTGLAAGIARAVTDWLIKYLTHS